MFRSTKLIDKNLKKMVKGAHDVPGADEFQSKWKALESTQPLSMYVSHIVLRYENQWYLAAFVSFYQKPEKDKKVESMRRPVYYVLADFNSGDIQAIRNCKECGVFCADPIDKSFSLDGGRQPQSQEWDGPYEYMDRVRQSILETNGSVQSLDWYEQYFDFVLSITPTEYRRFYRNLSTLDSGVTMGSLDGSAAKETVDESDSRSGNEDKGSLTGISAAATEANTAGAAAKPRKTEKQAQPAKRNPDSLEAMAADAKTNTAEELKTGSATRKAPVNQPDASVTDAGENRENGRRVETTNGEKQSHTGAHANGADSRKGNVDTGSGATSSAAPPGADAPEADVQPLKAEGHAQSETGGQEVFNAMNAAAQGNPAAAAKTGHAKENVPARQPAGDAPATDAGKNRETGRSREDTTSGERQGRAGRFARGSNSRSGNEDTGSGAGSSAVPPGADAPEADTKSGRTDGQAKPVTSNPNPFEAMAADVPDQVNTQLSPEPKNGREARKQKNKNGVTQEQRDNAMQQAIHHAFGENAVVKNGFITLAEKQKHEQKEQVITKQAESATAGNIPPSGGGTEQVPATGEDDDQTHMIPPDQRARMIEMAKQKLANWRKAKGQGALFEPGGTSADVHGAEDVHSSEVPPVLWKPSEDLSVLSDRYFHIAERIAKSITLLESHAGVRFRHPRFCFARDSLPDADPWLVMQAKVLCGGVKDGKREVPPGNSLYTSCIYGETCLFYTCPYVIAAYILYLQKYDPSELQRQRSAYLTHKAETDAEGYPGYKMVQPRIHYSDDAILSAAKWIDRGLFGIGRKYGTSDVFVVTYVSDKNQMPDENAFMDGNSARSLTSIKISKSELERGFAKHGYMKTMDGKRTPHGVDVLVYADYLMRMGRLPDIPEEKPDEAVITYTF